MSTSAPVRVRSLLKSGRTKYAGGWAVAAVSQVVLAAVATRVLDPADLGRFAIALVIGNLAGVVLAASVRRMAVHGEPGADLNDLRITALGGGLLGVIAAFLIGALALDPLTGLIAAEFAAWRMVDAYSEVAIGIWQRLGRLGRAGGSIAARNAAAVAVAASAMPVAGLVPALAMGFLARALVAAVDGSIAQPGRLAWVPVSALVHTLRLALRISAIAIATVSVELLPTLGLGIYGGLDEAGLLAPLGRIRMGFVMVASAMAEMFFREMLVAARDGQSVLSVARVPARWFLVLAGLAVPVLCLGGAELVFGSILAGEAQLVALACIAGIGMGGALIYSSTVTATGRLELQVTAYVAAMVVAVIIPALTGWTVSGFFIGQGAAAVTAILVIYLGTRGRTVQPRQNPLETWSQRKQT